MRSPDRQEPPARGPAVATGELVVLIAAHNEGDRVGACVHALAETFPGAELVVADDASNDATAEVARSAGARVVQAPEGSAPAGKGGNMTRAAETVGELGESAVVLLCDADLGPSAARLEPLVAAVRDGSCDLAIAAFARRVGGGFGLALRYARWAIRRRCGYEAGAPISGQRALSIEAFRAVVPFADGYGMEIGITVDAVRAGMRARELELPLEHRATGKTFGGFLHRARQLRDFTRVYRARARA